MVRKEVSSSESGARLKEVVGLIGWPRSSFYAKRKKTKKRPGPRPKARDPELVEAVTNVGLEYPWWGYKRIAVICRRHGMPVSNRFVYLVLKEADLLVRRRPRKAELYQTARLFELLPSGPNELWQADVTYVHIPGHGWWYAVTVIDYFSRYLLALHLTPSYAAPEVNVALDLARAEAERLCGPLDTVPFLVTDNGSSFLARAFQRHVRGQFQHVRTRYRTPEQLGLLERFHQTLKTEEVYWQLYDNPADAREKLAAFRDRYNFVRPHWALRPVGGGDVVTPYEVYTGEVEIELPKWQGWAKAARRKLEALLEAEQASIGLGVPA